MIDAEIVPEMPIPGSVRHADARTPADSGRGTPPWADTDSDPLRKPGQGLMTLDEAASQARDLRPRRR